MSSPAAVTPAKRLRFVAIRVLRRAGLLSIADYGRFQLRRWQTADANREFLARNPTFIPPPEDLAFDAYNHLDWARYDEGGRLHAAFFARVINRAQPEGLLRILEWGCGPGRIVRHLPAFLSGRLEELMGTDYNPRTIAWCRHALAPIRFEQNELLPPLPLADGHFNVSYNFSVFTHLSAEVQLAWAAELHRVLRPGGILICTTQGNGYQHLLASDEERARFRRGDVVVQDGYKEGAKWFFAVHPERYVRDVLLRSFATVERVPTLESDGLPADICPQDVWLARKAGG